MLGSQASLADPKTSSSSSFERKQEIWSQINYYSPAEGFHSQGSYGTRFGLGAVAPEAKAESDDSDPEAVTGELHAPKPRIFLSHGTPWPVDLGLSLSKLDGKNALQGGAHAQWTVYEDFQMPSVALRASRSILNNYHEVKNLTTDSVELGVSYGIVRYVIVSFGVSQQWEKGSTQAREQFLSLTETQLPSWSRSRTAYSWGMNISPFTPYVQIGLEQSYWANKTQVSLAKLSFML